MSDAANTNPWASILIISLQRSHQWPPWPQPAPEVFHINSLESLEKFFTANADKLETTSINYSYKSSIPPKLLERIYVFYKKYLDHCMRPAPPGCLNGAAELIDNCDFHIHKCHCTSTVRTPKNEAGMITVINFTSLATHPNSDMQESNQDTHDSGSSCERPGSRQHEGLTRNFQHLYHLKYKIDDAECKSICFSPQKTKYMVLEIGSAMHSFILDPKAPILKCPKVSPCDILVSQVRHSVIEWGKITEACTQYLVSINYQVMNEDDDNPIDRRLLRRMFKVTGIWEDLQKRHSYQTQFLEKYMRYEENERLGDRASRVPDEYGEIESFSSHLYAPLQSLKYVSDVIKNNLIDGTNKLLERTHNIMSIDEAYRSREQNTSLKRLSWITFIFLPMLFVASLYGMNVDLLKDNPSWVSYLYIAIPLFVGLMVIVLVLKRYQNDNRDDACSYVELVRDWFLNFGRHLSVTYRRTPLHSLRKIIASTYTECPQMHLEHGEDGLSGTYDEERLFAAARQGWNSVLGVKLGKIMEEAPLLVTKLMITALDAGQERVLMDFITIKLSDENPLSDYLTFFKGALLRTAVQNALENFVTSAVTELGENSLCCSMTDFSTVLPSSEQGHRLSSAQYRSMLERLRDDLLRDPTTILMTPLQVASKDGLLNMVLILLKCGANVNAKPARGGRTALQAAAEAGHMKIVKRLLSQAANINFAPHEFKGRTALQGAAENGHIKIVGYLISRGADINDPPAPIGGRTALQAAAGGGHLGIVYLLLNKEAAIDAPGAMEDGRTALQAAAENGQWKIVQLLLRRKENVRFQEDMNVALHLALRNGHAAVVDMLIDRVQKIDKLKCFVEAIQGGHVAMLQYLFDCFGHGCVRGTAWGQLLLTEAAEQYHRQLNITTGNTCRKNNSDVSEMMIMLTRAGAGRS